MLPSQNVLFCHPSATHGMHLQFFGIFMMFAALPDAITALACKLVN